MRVDVAGALRHHNEGGVEEVWFFEPTQTNLPLSLVITQWGFDVRGENCAGRVLMRVFTPRWWSIQQKEELAQTYASIIELRAGGWDVDRN